MPEFAALLATAYDQMAARLEPGLKKLGVSWSSFQLLAAVHSSDGRVSQAELASRLGIAPATMTEAVQAQIKAGMVQQIPSEHDRRVKTLRLSPKGNRTFSQILQLLEEAEMDMLKGVSSANRAVVEKVLTRVAENLETAGTKSLR